MKKVISVLPENLGNLQHQRKKKGGGKKDAKDDVNCVHEMKISMKACLARVGYDEHLPCGDWMEIIEEYRCIELCYNEQSSST